MQLRRKKINLINFPLDSFNKKGLIRYILQKYKAKKPLFVITVNSEFAYLAFVDKKIETMLNNSSLNLADGVGILWAAKFLSISLPANNFSRELALFFKFLFSILTIIIYPSFIKNPIPEKISGSDFIWDLANFAAQNNLKIFLLGGGPTVAEQAALKLQTDVYGLKVAGTYAGSPKIEDEKKIINLIKKTGSDILMVAYGVPKEELWLNRNLKKTGVKIGIGVGGTFDFLAGRVSRAPRFIQKIGLEWLYRLIIQPWRFKRQLKLIKFALIIYKYKINQ